MAPKFYLSIPETEETGIFFLYVVYGIFNQKCKLGIGVYIFATFIIYHLREDSQIIILYVTYI